MDGVELDHTQFILTPGGAGGIDTICAAFLNPGMWSWWSSQSSQGRYARYGDTVPTWWAYPSGKMRI